MPNAGYLILNVIRLSVIMISALKLSIIMQSVMAPQTLGKVKEQ
jgi:hypothetical protein